MDTKIPTPRDLPNKPLIEAIFEVQWELQSNGPVRFDPGFPLFQGRYYDQISGDYPVAVPLPASQFPEQLIPNAVRYQFRAGESNWPVTQIGPGILTVNDTDNYRWSTFRGYLTNAITALFDAYPTKIWPLKPTQATFRYINALSFENASHGPAILNYLRNALHTHIAPEPLLFEESTAVDKPIALSLSLMYELLEPRMQAGLNIALGQARDKPAILFDIVVQTTASDVPQTMDTFARWIDDAHRVVDKWFFALVRGDLLTSFEKT